MEKLLVTATPPTTNGDLHVGHLSGPYLAADVFTRYQKMNGNKVVYICSGDDHQSYVETMAQKKGLDPRELTRFYTIEIKKTLRSANIEQDIFTSSLSNERHIQFVQSFFMNLYSRGRLKEKVAPIFFCETCRRYLFESYIQGFCPFCGEMCAGNLCEACGRVNNPIELHEPHCSICNSLPTLREYKGIFLPLNDYRDILSAYVKERLRIRPHLQALYEAVLSNEIPDYPITYPSQWGIPVPIPKFKDQVINVWFEMFPGHIFTTKVYAELENDRSLADQLWKDGATIVQFLGYDNSFFNAIVHIISSIASGEGYKLPDAIITNEFYLLDGEKFSTSRNHAIWGKDILRKTPADLLRFYLAKTNPENWQTSFSYEKFEKWVKETLVGSWNSLIIDFYKTIQIDFDGKIPGGEYEIDLHAIALTKWAKQSLERYYNYFDFSLRGASLTLEQFVERCREYFYNSGETHQDTKRYRKHIASVAYLLKSLCYFSRPIMPNFSDSLSRLFRLNESKNGELKWEDIQHPLDQNVPIGHLRQNLFEPIHVKVQ